MFYSHLYTQKFNLKRTDGTDEYSMPKVIKEEKNIPCRITYKNKLIVASNGEQKTSEGNIITDKEVKVNDLIHLNGTDYKVISANPLYDFDNNLQGYQAYF